MKMREMEVLVRVVETGSMTRAARQLDVTPAAVSGVVARAEATLGVRLFERTTRSLHPTDEGLVILEGCRDVLDRWRRALDDARGQRSELVGTVHLAAPADTTYGVLDEVVVAFAAEHPRLRVVLHVSDAIQHVHRDAIDLAIRYGPLPDSTLTARRLVEAPGILVAAPTYLAAHGAPADLDALAEHRCVTLLRAGVAPSSWELHEGGATHRVPLRSALCGNGYLARRWAVAGRGIALKNLFDVIDDLEAGRLVRVLPAVARPAVAIHAVFPSRRFLPARVRALGDAVGRHFAERAARCEAWLGAQS
ncbi:MAG: LysR family transcriptional regulator [Myxococcota bacterium]